MTNQQFIQETYLKTRYMQKLSDEDFMRRFNSVFENMCFIDDNAKISPGVPDNPKNLFWMKHWIEICAEAELRNIFENQINNVFLEGKTHTFLKKINVKKLKEIRKNIGNNAYFYKYGKKENLEKLLYSGEILLRPASYYSDSSLNNAIKDDELSRLYILNSDFNKLNAELKTENETHNLVNGFYTKNINTDYYIFCLSNVFEPRLFNDFDADSCLIIKNPSLFISKLGKVLPDNIFKFEQRTVSYFDPLLDNPLSVSIPFSKDFKYSYQNEYRIAFTPYKKRQKIDSFKTCIGNISEFAEIVDIL